MMDQYTNCNMEILYFSIADEAAKNPFSVVYTTFCHNPFYDCDGEVISWLRYWCFDKIFIGSTARFMMICSATKYTGIEAAWILLELLSLVCFRLR